MLRAIWFMFQVGLLVAAAVWVADRPGTIEVSWLGYDIQAHIGFALLLLSIALLALLLLYRACWGLFGLPKNWRRYRERKDRDNGWRALTLGLSAVAAGDGKMASYHAQKTRQLLPEDKGLSLLLEGQAARLKGDRDTAREAFEKLIQNKDTAFLGLRGLMLEAAEQNDMVLALSLAQQALKLYPKQPWILRAVYGLELRSQKWQDAEKTLMAMKRYRVIDAEKMRSDRVAILLAEAADDQRRGRERAALKKWRQAQKMDPAFVPSAFYLAGHYIAQGKRRNAVAVVEQAWKENPHPDLVKLWRALAPKAGGRQAQATRLGWFEKLMALKPDSAESQMAAAQAAMDEGLWGAAEQYLKTAETLRPNARLYRLWARLEEQRGHMDEARRMLEKATEAPADKVWTCTETGQVYEHWSPVADPHGSFNTIVWGYPQPRQSSAFRELTQKADLLLTA